MFVIGMWKIRGRLVLIYSTYTHVISGWATSYRLILIFREVRLHFCPTQRKNLTAGPKKNPRQADFRLREIRLRAKFLHCWGGEIHGTGEKIRLIRRPTQRAFTVLGKFFFCGFTLKENSF